MGLDRTDSIAILDVLAPEPGWETDLAILSSYSVDLVAAAAIVVALAGEGDDHERMRKAPLARACERLRDRFRIVCQAGRVVVPKSGAETLVIADRWIREISRDENNGSWHAKLALVRYRRVEVDTDQLEWRLWIGSRNLTRDTSWDSALTAVGRASTNADRIDRSIARVGAILAEKAALPDWSAERADAELRRVHWEWPEDVREVVSFDLWPDAAAAPGLPSAPPDVCQVVAVGPFVDGAVAGRLGSWGETAQRQLLTTAPTLATLAAQRAAPLKGFSRLHQLEGSVADEDGDADQDETGDDQMLEVHRGLHAKLIWARSPGRHDLWLGSANLTKRAWNGDNCEAVAHVRVAPSVGAGLMDGLIESLATEVQLSDLVEDPPSEDLAAMAFDRLRNRVAAAWDGRLERGDSTEAVRCVASTPPLCDEDRASLSVRLLGQTVPVHWKADATVVKLPAVAVHRQTELVVLELQSTDDPDLVAQWIARAVADPPFEIARDRAVLARLMGPRAFLVWLRTLLEDVTGDSGDEPWPAPTPGDRNASRPWERNSAAAHSSTPTLECVLRAWVRNPHAVRQVDQAITVWAREMRDARPDDADEGERNALRELQVFESEWAVVRTGLDLDGARS